MEVKTKIQPDRSLIKDLESNLEDFSSGNPVISCLKVDPGFRYVLAGTKDGKLIRWDLTDTAHTVFSDKIVDVVPSRDHGEFNDILGIDCRDTLALSVCFYSSLCGQMQWWDSRDVSLLDFIKEADPSTCRRIKISSDGRYAITTGDFSYRIWKFDVPTGKYQLQCDLVYGVDVGYSKKMSCVDIWNDRLLVVGDKKNVFFFNLADHKRLGNLRQAIDTLKIYERAPAESR
jgi:WD40 repeat protein